MRSVEKPQTLLGCCFAMTVTSVTTHTAWIPLCTPYQKGDGNANGVCAACSVVQPPQASMLIGRIITHIVPLVPAWSLVPSAK